MSDVIITAARAAACTWAERQPEVPRWTGLVPDEDVDRVEHELFGRPMEEEEAASFAEEFCRAYCRKIEAQRAVDRERTAALAACASLEISDSDPSLIYIGGGA